MGRYRKYLKIFNKGNDKSKFRKDGNYFYKNHNDLKIYTHDIACIKRAFNQIFINNVYDFNSKVDNPLIIDAGANIGMGVLYWKKKYPKSKIIAFEPSKEAYKSLLKNVEVNKLDNVKCINKALSDKEGIQVFTTNEIISGSLNTDKDLAYNYEVETTTLGSYLQNPVDFLKIDIEGAEKFIFEDFKRNILNLDYIFLEYHSFVNEPQYLSKYLNVFEANGYRYFIEDEFKKTSHFINKKVSLNQDMQLNIWARKADL